MQDAHDLLTSGTLIALAAHALRTLLVSGSLGAGHRQVLSELGDLWGLLLIQQAVIDLAALAASAWATRLAAFAVKTLCIARVAGFIAVVAAIEVALWTLLTFRAFIAAAAVAIALRTLVAFSTFGTFRTFIALWAAWAAFAAAFATAWLAHIGRCRSWGRCRQNAAAKAKQALEPSEETALWWFCRGWRWAGPRWAACCTTAGCLGAWGCLGRWRIGQHATDQRCLPIGRLL